MRLTETILFYLVIGAAVAVAVWLASDVPSKPRYFRAVTAVFFWPVYLPMLLTPESVSEPRGKPAAVVHRDELARKIAEVERELDVAFSSLDGWTEVLSRERQRIAELCAAWNSQADRIRDMDCLLVDWMRQDEMVEPQLAVAVDRLHQSEQARRNNFARLQRIRDHAYGELTTTLARIREPVSLIHLAKFTGAPASRAEQLVAEIAASIEGLSEVAAWREPALNIDTQCSVRQEIIDTQCSGGERA